MIFLLEVDLKFSRFPTHRHVGITNEDFLTFSAEKRLTLRFEINSHFCSHLIVSFLIIRLKEERSLTSLAPDSSGETHLEVANRMLSRLTASRAESANNFLEKKLQSKHRS